MKNKWGNITSVDVIKAIEIFNNKNDDYPEPRNTFLIYNDKKYPAKHIRGLAYYVANSMEISKNDYSGGQETVNFFKKLDFVVQYKKQIIKKPNRTIITNKEKTTKAKKMGSRKLNPVDQKNALQILFQRHFGVIETEKKFDWLKTPNHEDLPEEYKLITEALLDYRNQDGFQKSNYRLLCDIFLEEHKLIIEYDENQHFSIARQIVLENYPDDIMLHFSKEEWIESCKKITAIDNNPIDRDEKRAFYDAVRDIEADKNGFRLIRIKHGDYDWEAKSAGECLKKLIKSSFKVKEQTVSHHKVARLILTEKHYYNNNVEPNYEKLDEQLFDFINKTYKKKHFEFLNTPGGYLFFQIPDKLRQYSIQEIESKHLEVIYNEAEFVINDYVKKIPLELSNKLIETVDYFTIGMDGFHISNDDYLDGYTVELVAIYDMQKQKVINWTGKFYPTEAQKVELIKINDLDSHFMELNNQRIVILGCHDLNVYNPRGQANANPNGWKRKLAEQFKKKCLEFNPDIILQHPHTTDTPNIWNLPWRAIERELPNVKHFASGIKYFNWEGEPRGSIEKVLSTTKKGDVIDYL